MVTFALANQAPWLTRQMSLLAWVIEGVMHRKIWAGDEAVADAWCCHALGGRELYDEPTFV